MVFSYHHEISVTEPTIVEVDPYKKPKVLLEVSPKGLVPGLRLNRYNPARSLNESIVILDYLEECVFVSANPLASSDFPQSRCNYHEAEYTPPHHQPM